MENFNEEDIAELNSFGLIVHTCDRYELLYQAFEYFFKKNWPYKSLNINYYFFTEEENFRSDVFTVIKTGKGEWTNRLRAGLKQIPDEYIIYCQEDMWLNKPVDGPALKKILTYVSQNNINMMKLTCNDVYKTKPTGVYLKGLQVTLLDNVKSSFVMSHQIAVWKKEFLNAQLTFKENPWQNEKRSTKRLKKLKAETYQIDLLQEYDYPPINKNKDNAIIGQYFAVSKNAQLNDVAYIFINKLKLDSDASVREYAARLDFHLKNGITHDGQSKPRKDDIVKKIKKYLLGKQ